MTTRDELIARVEASLADGRWSPEHAADLRAILALATAPPNVGESVDALAMGKSMSRLRLALAKYHGGSK